jgi:hypothetical protein
MISISLIGLVALAQPALIPHVAVAAGLLALL